MLILMALRDAGMTAKDVTLVPAGGVGANLSAVVNGAVDTAMTGAPIFDENTDKVQPVFWVRDVMSPDIMQTVLVTTEGLRQGASGRVAQNDRRAARGRAVHRGPLGRGGGDHRPRL